MRMHGNCLCEIGEMQPSRVLAAADGDDEEDEEDEDEERRQDDEEEEETVWTSPQLQCPLVENARRSEVRS
jgi:hypothetical protein